MLLYSTVLHIRQFSIVKLQYSMVHVGFAFVVPNAASEPPVTTMIFDMNLLQTPKLCRYLHIPMEPQCTINATTNSGSQEEIPLDLSALK